MAGVEFELTGDNSQLKATLADTQKALGKTEKSVESLTDATEDQTKAERKAAQAAKAQAQAVKNAARESEKRAGEMKRGISAALGDQVNKVDDLNVAFGALGLTVAGIGLGVAALAKGVMVGTGALVSMSQATVQLIRDMDGFSPAVNAANDALDGAAVAAGRVQGELATDLAPTVERIAVLATAMGLAAENSMQAVVNGADVATSALTRMASFGANPSTEALLTMAEAGVALARVMGLEVPQGVSDFIDSTRKQLSGVENMTTSFEQLEESMGKKGYLAQAIELIDFQKEMADSTDTATESIAKQAEAADDAAASLDAFLAASIDGVRQIAAEERVSADERISALRDIASNAQAQLAVRAEAQRALTEIETEQVAAREASEAESLERLQEQLAKSLQMAADLKDGHRADQDAKDKASADLRRQINQQLVDSVLGGITQITQQQLDARKSEIDAAIAVFEGREKLSKKRQAQLDKLEKQRKRAAVAAFAAQKVSALASIAIDTARNAVSFNQPPPFGLGPPQGTIAALALGAVQAAIVAATPAPKFADGGMVQRDASMTPDQRLVTAEVGEAILNPRAVAAVGMDTLQDLNQRGDAVSTRQSVRAPQVGVAALRAMMIEALGGDDGIALMLRGSAPGTGGTYR